MKFLQKHYTSEKFINLLSYIYGGIVWIYIIYKAYYLPITCDESSSAFLIHNSYKDIMFSPFCFNTANNHVLNTLLAKFSVQLFGYAEWAFRIPNCLSFIFYFASAKTISNTISKTYYEAFLGLCILISMPYVNDFFSLFRGYGLALSFQMMSFAFALKFINETHKRHLFYMAGFMAGLAVYANFTWIIYYCCLLFTVNLFVFLNAPKNCKVANIINLNWVPLFITGFLMLLIYKPMIYLLHSKEFGYGTDSFWASYKTWVENIIYQLDDLLLYHLDKLNIVTYGTIILFIIAVIVSIFSIIKNNSKNYKSLFLSTILLFSIILFSVIQYYLLYTKYPDTRKMLFYFPLIALMFFSLYCLWKNAGKFKNVLTAVIIILNMSYFASCTHLNYVKEWWYDESSKKVVSILMQAPIQKNISIACSDYMGSSLAFYAYFHYSDKFKIISTNEFQLLDTCRYDYIYLTGDRIKQVSPKYTLIKRFLWDRFLLKYDAENFIAEEQKTRQHFKITDDPKNFKTDSILFDTRKNIKWDTLRSIL